MSGLSDVMTATTAATTLQMGNGQFSPTAALAYCFSRIPTNRSLISIDGANVLIAH